MSNFEREIIYYLSLIRQNPKKVIDNLAERLGWFEEGTNHYLNPNSNVTFYTQEGPSAVQEAIDFLKSQAPVSGLYWVGDIHQSTSEFVNFLTTNQNIQHCDENGNRPFDRVRAAGFQKGDAIDETIFRNHISQKSVDCVIDLLVNDGVPSRPIRDNVFKRENTGAVCAVHQFDDNDHVFIVDLVKDYEPTGSEEIIQLENQSDQVSPKPESEEENEQEEKEVPDFTEDEEEDEPEGYVEKSQKTKKKKIGGKKFIVTTTMYEMEDGEIVTRVKNTPA